MNKHDEEEYESYTNLPSWVNNLPATVNAPYVMLGIDVGSLPSKSINLGYADALSYSLKDTVEASDEGATCSSCQEDYPYAIAKSNFVCTGCKLWENCK